MKKQNYWIIGISFIILLIWQIFSGRSFIPHFSLNLALLFIAFLLPLVPLSVSFLLSLGAALILSPLSSGIVCFVSFLGIYLGGIVIFHFLDKEFFISRLLGGILIILLYYFIWGIVSVIISSPIFLPLLMTDCLGGVVIYSLLSYVSFRLY